MIRLCKKWILEADEFMRALGKNGGQFGKMLQGGHRGRIFRQSSGSRIERHLQHKGKG